MPSGTTPHDGDSGALVRRITRNLRRIFLHPRSEFRRLRASAGRFHQLPECDGGIYLYPDDSISRMISANEFEIAPRRVFRDVLRPGMTVLDAGANLGLYSVLAGKAVGPNGRVYGFEPSRREWKRAMRSVRANQLRNVTIVRAALSEGDGVTRLSVCDPERSAYNSIGELTHPDAVGHRSHTEEVECLAVDSFVRREKLSRVDVMKIDVEGAEELVLRGGRELLSREDAPLLLAELSDRTAPGLQSSAERVLQLLVDYGYRVYAIVSEADGYALKEETRRGHIDYSEVVAMKAPHMAALAGHIENVTAE